ncbi:hypothetical protein PX699_18685 [Sphingobium sp. H39-3-25]|uniref:hypothetical protein n=1 Tax=Sphingobium arseniciresistens TaxID=3030834 RepID=UPI0023B94647|nr:hypothetical protein [Sphingobium arseniciresistens]
MTVGRFALHALVPALPMIALLAASSSGEAQSPAKARTPALASVYTEVLAPKGTPLPRFKVDAAWPTLPDDMMLGQVSGVAVDRDDDVWIIHRPHSLSPTDNGLAQTPPIAKCCRPAPTVVRFSREGAYLAGWGTPQTGPVIDGVSQWPKSGHGIYVDAAKTVWFGGNGDGDHAVLNFTADGKFIRSFGKRETTGGNLDKALLGNPSDVFHEDGEVLVSDGYVNKRVIGFDDRTGAFKRYWGAYGSEPSGASRDGHFDQSQASTGAAADPASRSFGDIVHCIVKTKGNDYYVCDRRNNRAQLYRKDAKGKMTFVRDIVIAPETGGTRTVTDIALSPDEKYLYVADMMNGRIWILLRETDQVLGAIGRNGRYAGEFTWLHSIATDSHGNLYATEVNTGRRVQKFVMTGIE